jgi:uncharacterized DUF497 family protein
MRFEWDQKKNRSNRIKHKIGFELAREAFDDPWAISIRERVVEGEERWQLIGALKEGDLLLVAYTQRGEEVVRIISARKATPRERKVYEESREG